MAYPNQKSEKVLIEKRQVEKLQEKASLLDELLSLIEDKYLGDLMKEVEEEENIPLSKAKTLL